MRLKNIPASKPAIAASEFCIDDPAAHKGQWSLSFFQSKPLYIEIGMGKGQFLMTQAELHPERGFLGIEYYSSVLYRALQRLEADPLDNVRLLRFDAKDITDIFAEGEVEHLYLNFSDPWPKERHVKRRLTSPLFLDRYDSILSRSAIIEFKTDNADLFAYSVESINAHPAFSIAELTYDLHADERLMQENVMTEYEERFSAEGKPICKLIAMRSS